jgi:acyl-CoA thioester hydrolase
MSDLLVAADLLGGAPTPFEQRFQVGWGHLDANAHMSNTAYMDLAANVRVAYFAAAGFTIEAFAELRFGPVIRREELEYFRELRLLDEVRVTLLLAGLSEDASRFRFRNEFWREDGALVARLTSLGGWLDLGARGLIAPPPALAAALRGLGRASDFEGLPLSGPKSAAQEIVGRPRRPHTQVLQPLETPCQQPRLAE